MSTSRTRAAALLLAAASLFGLSPAAFAQTGAASITGLLTDTSGAAVPGVTVTATNQATNVPYTGQTNDAGAYTITALPVGTYVVKAELTGFKTPTTRPIPLEAKQIARLDFRLEVGALEDTVEVTAEAPVLQTESSTVGEVISGNTVQSLPLNGRNPGQLALLLPGAVTVNPRGFTNIGNINLSRPFVNGHREQTNNYTVDGLDVNETIDNRISYQPTPDALAQISVETNNYAADTGNVAGAVISNVVKSGANQFRGNVFEFYRNSDFDANTWENNRSGAPRQERKQHIFGATLGGPIVKDKIFFFADYQGSWQDAPGSATASVAPESWRRGDLSSIATPIRDPLTGQPFPGNQIPLSRISPTARAILSDLNRYPLPNRTVSGVTGNYVGDTLFTVRAHQGDLRLDWNASPNDKLFARASFARYEDRREKQPFPLMLTARNDQPFYNIGVNWNRVFGPSVINEVLVGYSHTTVVAETLDWGGIGSGNAAYGIAGGQPIDGLSCITNATGACGGLNGLTPLGAIGTDSDTLAKTYQINEKLTWIRGRHAFKVGGQFLRYDQRRFYAGNNGVLGFIGFNGSFTGSQFADFLLDRVSSKGRGGGDPSNPWTHLQNRIGLFIQDDFKATPDLTLNLGLRWAYTSPLVEKDNRQSNFDLVTGQQLFARDGSLEDRALYSPYYKGFEPRVGFAWSASNRLVFRGGYGISQYMEGTGANLRLPLNPPDFFESNVNYDATTGAGTISTGFAELIPGTTPTGNVRAYDPELRPQFTHQWNAFAEYRLTEGMSAQVGYVGHRANHLVAPVEGNQALPGVGDPATWAPKNTRRPLYRAQPLITTIATTASRARSEYNSIQASVRQREWNGVEFLASYTFAKANTNNRGYYGGGAVVASEGAYWQNTYDPDAEWGPAFHDVRHNFVFSATYELPWGRGRQHGSDWSGLRNAVLGGWKIGGIFQTRSGIPLTVIDGRARSLQGERGFERPNCIGNPVPSGQSITADATSPASSRWLDIGAFQAAALGTFGNCGIGIARAPGYVNLDAAISKRFDVGATRYLEFRVEAFNVTNTPSFGPPARDLSVPNTFGLITSTVSSPRVIELALKFYF